ncbi:hypothetical protein LP2241_50320 [Pseudolactococcus piscium]|nr:hypothetical protein LP2241_50320 [Lactococcus piscium]
MISGTSFLRTLIFRLTDPKPDPKNKEPLYLKGSFAIYGAEGSRTPVQMPCYISVYNHRDCLNLTS